MKKQTINLSYSTLNMLFEHPHNYLCKVMGLKQPERDYFVKGHELHRIVQDHVAGIKYDKRLDSLTEFVFPLVEEKDFDERLKFQFEVPYKSENRYLMRGYFDGLNPDNKHILEIKTSTKPWSQTKFVNSTQRKVYALAQPSYTTATLITCDWDMADVRVYDVPLTDQDRREAMEWILKGIEVIEKGDFTSDLIDGKICPGRCYYGSSCAFV